MRRVLCLFLMAVLLLNRLCLAGESAFTAQEKQRILRMSPLPDLPEDPTNQYADDPNAAHLGRFLFFDPRLSINGEISCASCHDPEKGLADGKPVAEGVLETTRNTPTLWNAAYNRWFFLDGRADTLWSQALGPIENPLEMAFTRVDFANLIYSDAGLREAYVKIFGRIPELSGEDRLPAHARPVPTDPQHAHHRAWLSMNEHDRQAVNVIFSNLGKAFAAYERRLLSRRSPFDVFVEGLRESRTEKLDALSPEAQLGLKLFVGRGNCRLCHTGPMLTDREFHNIRLPARGGGRPDDPGRYRGVHLLADDPFNAAGKFSDDPMGPTAEQTLSLLNSPENWGAFKTPSLRNVARTGPYMHQGQFASIREVLKYYSTMEGAVPLGHHQKQEQILVPLNFGPEEINALEAFLHSLTDEGIDPALLRRPVSPLRDQGTQ